MSGGGWLPERLIADFERADEEQGARVAGLFAALEAADSRRRADEPRTINFVQESNSAGD